MVFFEHIIITLGAHAQQGWITSALSASRASAAVRPENDITYSTSNKIVWISLKLLRCRDTPLPELYACLSGQGSRIGNGGARQAKRVTACRHAISLCPKGRDADNPTHPSGLSLSRTVADGAGIPTVVVL